MKKNELKLALDQANIYEEAYSLDGGLPDEKYTLDQGAGSTWSVYYSERGKKTSFRQFSSEDEACDYFLKTIKDDQSVFKK